MMITVVTLAVVVPALLAVTFLGLSRIKSTPLFSSLAHARGADQRGIALQTIIIMVVLLAVAGAVAAVLATRAGEETDRFEEDENARFREIDNESGCLIAGGTWDDDGPDGTANNADDGCYS